PITKIASGKPPAIFFLWPLAGGHRGHQIAELIEARVGALLEAARDMRLAHGDALEQRVNNERSLSRAGLVEGDGDDHAPGALRLKAVVVDDLPVGNNLQV